jgi:hypothetical protein
LFYSRFPPPEMAAYSLPDTISVNPRSQRLTPRGSLAALQHLQTGTCRACSLSSTVPVQTPHAAPVSPSPKNNSLPPHSAYNKQMRTSNHRVLSRFGSLLVVLCLLAAPLCATRCTLSSCAKPDTQEQSTTACHHKSNFPGNSSVLAAIASPTCVPGDTLLTTLPASNSRPHSANSDSPAHSAILNSSSSSGASALIALRITNRSSSPGDYSTFASNPPLRL